jgi:hypothetical protein
VATWSIRIAHCTAFTASAGVIDEAWYFGGRLHPQEARERLGQRSANATGLGKLGDCLGVVVRLSAHPCQT